MFSIENLRIYFLSLVFNSQYKVRYIDKLFDILNLIWDILWHNSEYYIEMLVILKVFYVVIYSLGEYYWFTHTPPFGKAK